MGKAPAFQFYPGDWFREPGLKIVDLAVRGAWAELLMIMWDTKPQGYIKTSVDGFAKLWRIEPIEACFIIDELNENNIADINFYDEETLESVKKTSEIFQGLPENIPLCPSNVPQMSPFKYMFISITSRRIYKAWEIKEKERLKKQHQRGKKEAKKDDVPQMSPPLSSSSSSSSSSKDKKIYKKESGEIFFYWQKIMNTPASKFTDGRKQKIKTRLKEGYTINDIKKAIDGCRSSTYHMGENDSNTVYNDLTLICRTGEKLEWFMQKLEAAPTEEPRGYDRSKLDFSILEED